MDKENVSGCAKPGTPPRLRFSMDTTVFRSKYQRNNKRGGLKNLRCFPTCGDTHKARGFCGRPIRVTVSAKESEGAFDASKLLCVGEFAQADARGRFTVGKHVAAAVVKQLQRTPATPFKPLIFGERVEGASPVCFEFNKKRKGWHYGWSSNKHSCNTEHCFRVYALEQVGIETFSVVGIVSSPPFVLYCRRRRRFHIEPSSSQGLPAKKRIKTAQAPISENEDLSLEAAATAECLVSLATACNQAYRNQGALGTLADSSVQYARELVMS